MDHVDTNSEYPFSDRKGRFDYHYLTKGDTNVFIKGTIFAIRNYLLSQRVVIQTKQEQNIIKWN